MAQLFHGHIFYESGGIISIILMIAIAVVYCQLPVTLHEARLLLKKTFVVMICFLMYIIVVVIALSIRMITAKTSNYQHFSIWLSIAITYPTSLLLFPVAFLLCFYPVGKLCKSILCEKMRRFPCCLSMKQKTKNKRVVHFQQNPVFSTHAVPTFPASTRVSPPSSTYFQVPYTNNFTHITTENAPLVPDECGGYGSVAKQ